MLEINQLAFQNADVLTAIAQSPHGLWSGPKDLARHLNRDDSNLGKTLRRLTAEGILADPPLSGLTEAGQAQLAAIQRARSETGSDRWPATMIVRNPANRLPAEAAIAALADTIESAGDVLQPVILTPPDATDVRMLLAGEHRWRAVQLLAEQDRLPPALAAGLPFTERAAGDAEQILIRIVENSGRTDLSPLDDARQLLALQEATGWSAREIAKKTGRSPADSDTGVRDVQVKIKVAREATDFFLQQYELDGSWDRLRDSVARRVEKAEPSDRATSEDPTQLKPRPATEQELSQALATYGTATLAAMPAPAPAAAERDPDWLLDNPDWAAEAMQTIHDKGESVSLRVFSRIGDVPGWFVSVSTNLSGGGFGESYRTGPTNPIFPNRVEALQAARRRLLERHPLAAPWVRNWLDQQMGPHFVNGRDCLNASNAGEARRAAGLERRASNSGGGKGKPSATDKTFDLRGAEIDPAIQTRIDEPAPAPQPDLAARADRMAEAAIDGRSFVLVAAIAEIVEAAESHLSGLRRALVEGGQDLTEFEDDTSDLREAMTQALAAVDGLGLGEGEGLDPVEPFSRRLTQDAPFVPVRKSITPDHITCLEDGRRFSGGLRHHLLSRHNLTPAQYREKWSLPADYPMVAPNHAKRQHDALRAAALRSVGR